MSQHPLDAAGLLSSRRQHIPKSRAVPLAALLPFGKVALLAPWQGPLAVVPAAILHAAPYAVFTAGKHALNLSTHSRQ